MNVLKDLRDLFVPKRCLHCLCIIPRNVSFLCTNCSIQLEYTDFFSETENSLEKIFWGKTMVSAASSLYFYQKNSPVQTLLKALKYQRLQEVGLFTAKNIITVLKQKHRFHQVTMVIPVPLHPKKEHKRGYNQIELFGKTLADYMGVPFIKDGLIRTENNKSQTKQSKEERYRSVKNSYVANTQHHLNGQHILIVDDVVTTGATLISCCKALHNNYTIDISIITIACVV